MAHSSSSAQIAQRYALSLLRVADQSHVTEIVEQDMRDMNSMLHASPDLVRALSSQILNKIALQNVVADIALKANFNPISAKFLRVLAQNGRLSHLQTIIQQILKLCAERRGETDAEVRTAVALTPAQQKLLQDNLKQSTGKHVHLNITIDPSLMGGMVVTIGSHMIDDTVKSKLDRLKQNLQTSSNQNLNQKEVA